MKNLFMNKKVLAIIISAVFVITCAVVGTVVIHKNKVQTAQSTTTEKAETSNINEETTEGTTETVNEENTSEDVTEASTSSNTEATKNQEATTKKPVSKPETTTKAQVTTVDQGTLDTLRLYLYRQYGGEEGYKTHLQEIANAKCYGCGNHNCPSMEYRTNRLGDIDSYYWNQQKCPNYGKTKCSHCGKILTDDSNLINSNPEKYCRGNCYYTFK